MQEFSKLNSAPRALETKLQSAAGAETARWETGH